MNIEADKLYTPREVAEFLNCGLTNVYSMMGKDLAVTNVGANKKGFRVRGSDLVAFLDARRLGGPKSKMAFKHLGIE